MITFLIIWYLVGVAILWVSEAKRGNLQFMHTVKDWLYAIVMSLTSWVGIVICLFKFR